ncbi:hypothetical protein FRC08_009795 [Ceratobasidium sp. 394]|nr:hypothetical protein FRC08_009795 [Ceratobasidium sp. 394]
MMMHYAGFSGLASLSHLESIELNLRGLDCSERLLGLNGPNLFPSLRHLALYYVPDMKVLRRFWGLSVLVSQLHSVHLHFGYKFWSLSENLRSDHIMQLLVEKSPCINVLTLDPLDEARAYQYPDTMFSLMSRLPLHELRIVTTSSIQRSQPQVGRTAIHNIRILDLPTHCINLSELKLHTHLMPSLKVLKLKIDVSGVDWDYSFGDPSEACSLQELHIVDIKFDENSSEMDWVKIAQFLSCAWPSAQIILDDGVEQEHAGLKKALEMVHGGSDSNTSI